jgi:HD-like signal output (HDOD) protein
MKAEASRVDKLSAYKDESNVVFDSTELNRRVMEHFEANQPEPTSFPAMASRVIDLAEHPDVDISKLAHLIERDPAICAAVLAVANSAVNRRGEPVQNVRMAMTRLGLKRVANIAVGVACRSLFDVELRVQYELFPKWWSRLFHASMTEAFTSSFVAMERMRNASEGIFLAGMLRNIGASLVLRSLASLIVSGNYPLMPSESDIELLVRSTRVAIGVKALTRLKLPESLVNICQHQTASLVPRIPERFDILVIQLVSSLNELRMGTLDTTEPIRLLLSASQELKIDRSGTLEIAKQLMEHAAQVELLFSTTDDADETGYLEFIERVLG